MPAGLAKPENRQNSQSLVHADQWKSIAPNEKEIAVIQHKNCNQFTKMQWISGLTVAILCLMPALARAADDAEARVKASGETFKELVNSQPGIPANMLNKSECVIFIPSAKKGGFIIAGHYGRGAMSCRSGQNFDGAWSAPIMMQSSGGSVGFQAGGQVYRFRRSRDE